MAKSRTESPEIRKRQILDAARVLLAQKGYQDIKMDDVAKKAALAKGTLYLHFKDKSQIVTAVFQDLMDQLEDKFNLLKNHSGLDLLHRIAATNLQFLRENRDFFSEFIQLKDSLTGPNRTIVQKRFHSHMRMMVGFVDSAVLNKEIPKGDPFISTFFFMSLIRMFWVKDQIFWMNPSKKVKKSVASEIDLLMNMFLNGIQGIKEGKKL